MVDAKLNGDDVEEGWLVSREGVRYAITRGIPRFVPADNYATGFGLQWNHFRRTQLDSFSGHPITHDRFYSFTGFTPQELRGKRVLDVGCGAGRFAEIALAAGATVVALDYSSAVDACRANHADKPQLDVVQGDIYALPFELGGFDFVYCLGVLQHTPDARAAFAALPPMLKPGAKLAIDLYPKLLRNALWPKYWLRPITSRMNADKLFARVQRMVPVLLPISLAVGRLPVVGKQLRKFVPVVNYEGVLPLSPVQVKEWAVLDTFDMLAPAYDNPQTVETVREWFNAAGLVNILVERMGFVIGRGEAKPQL
ncbi:MAG: class I SAM-dependent methyltransferase [Gemmatimonadaceae bacterium]